MKYHELAATILSLIGGERNVSSLQHCATRLRFKINDMKLINETALNQTEGIAGVKKQANGIHIIIGQDVDEVYEILMESTHFHEELAVEENFEEAKETNVFMRFMNVIADCLVPLLPALIAAGLTTALLTLCTTFGWLSTDSSTHKILNVIASAPLYFLPFLVASSSAKKFHVNASITMAVTAVLLYPSLPALGGEGVTSMSFLGLPVQLLNYSSALVPVLLVVFFQQYVEKLIHKIVPKIFSVFLEPLLVFLILSVAALVIFGPLGSYLGTAVTWFMNTFIADYKWLVSMMLAGFGSLLVATGMHYGLMPIIIANFAALGYDNFYAGACFSGAMALAGSVLALFFKSKNAKTKQIAGSTGFTALLGISEPALYGVLFKHKSVMIATIVSGLAGGLLAGLLGVNAYGMAPAGLTSIPVLVGPTFLNAILAMTVSFSIGFVISYILHKDESQEA